MTVIGVRDGVSLRFAKGALTGLEFGRFDRVVELREAFSVSVDDVRDALPYLPLESSLDMSDARYRGLNPYSGRQAQQKLAAGQRTLSLLQGQTLLVSGLPEPQVARLHMDFSLTTPLVYHLHTNSGAPLCA